MLFWVLVAPRNGVSYSLHPDVEGGNHGPSDEAFLDAHVMAEIHDTSHGDASPGSKDRLPLVRFWAF